MRKYNTTKDDFENYTEIAIRNIVTYKTYNNI